MHTHYIRSLIRTVADFPKPGILFYDIIPLLADPKGLKMAVDEMANHIPPNGVEAIAAIESRGFIFGSCLAAKLNLGFIPIRKKGKLPGEVISKTYSLEYGTDTLEISKASLRSPPQRCILVDDLLATGGTAKAAKDLLYNCGFQLLAGLFLLELEGLNGRDKIGDLNITSLMKFKI